MKKNIIIVILLFIVGLFILYVINDNINLSDDNKNTNDNNEENINKEELFEKSKDIYEMFLYEFKMNNNFMSILYKEDITIDDLDESDKNYYSLYYIDDKKEMNTTETDYDYCYGNSAESILDYDKCGYMSFEEEDFIESYTTLFGKKPKDYDELYYNGLIPCYLEGNFINCYRVIGGFTNDSHYTVNYIDNIEYKDGKVYIYESVVHFIYYNLEALYVISDPNDVDTRSDNIDILNEDRLETKLLDRTLSEEESKKIIDEYSDKYIKKFVHVFNVVEENVYWESSSKN